MSAEAYFEEFGGCEQCGLDFPLEKLRYLDTEEMTICEECLLLVREEPRESTKESLDGRER